MNLLENRIHCSLKGFVFFLSVILCGIQNQAKAQQYKRPNFVVIILDDNGPDYLGTYGGTNITPNMDKLAKEGIKFTNAFSSASACTPSRYTLLTGDHAGHNNSKKFLEENPIDEPYNLVWNTPLTNKTTTLARILGAADYQTGFVGKWHLGADRSELNLPQVNPDASVQSEEVDKKLQRYQKVLIDEVKRTSGFDFVESVIWENCEQIPYKQLRNHHIEWITKGAIDFLDQTKLSNKPFFLYLANTGIHGPSMLHAADVDPKLTPSGRMTAHLQYQPSRKEVIRRLKHAGVEVSHKNFGLAWMDDQVGAVTKKLKEMGEEKNTVVILLADHNVEPGKTTLYDKGMHIPMIWKWPAKWKAGQVRSALSQIPDIAPMLVDLAGLDASKFNFDGKSLANVSHDVNFQAHNDLYMEFGYTRAVRTNRYKYIAFKYPDSIIEKMKKGKLIKASNFINDSHQGQPNIAMRHFPGYFDQDQLYDLDQDSHEQHNLAGNPKYNPILKKMKQRLEEHLKTFKHPYDLSWQSYRESNEFQQKVDSAKAISIDFIPWWNGMVWPKK